MPLGKDYMKKILLLLILSLFLPMLLGCTQSQNTQATATATPIILSTRITSYLGISIGDTTSKVTAAFGEPTTIDTSFGCTYDYPNKYVCFDSNYLVVEICSWQVGQHLNGINIGDTLAQIKAICGEPDTIFCDIYYYNKYGVRYSLDSGGKVDYMAIYKGDK